MHLVFCLIHSVKIKFSRIFNSKFSNCEEDDSEYLELNWKAITDTVVESMPVLNDDLENSDINESEHYVIDKIVPINDQQEQNDIMIIIPETCDIATRYFAGYCYFKTFSKMRSVCQKCIQEVSKDKSTIHITEVLLKLKEYDSSKEKPLLLWPSEKYFQISHTHVEVFLKYFKENAFTSNIRQNILQKCIEATNINFPDWFKSTDDCYTHRLDTANFLIIVLLWKNCKGH